MQAERCDGGRLTGTFIAVIGIAALAAILLAMPGRTVTTRYLNDLFIFLDGAHRIMSGQVPHRDYHTPIGALADVLPALGILLTGSFGAAMPAGMALLIVVLSPAMAHVLASRLRPSLALPTAAYLVLILALPANIGEAPTHLSFAMFYNRIGWASLGLLLVMVLPPERGTSFVRDAACAALLTLIQLYTKVSYGAVSLAFLGFMLLDRRATGWSGLALAIVVAVTAFLEAVCRLPSAYLTDLVLAGRTSGAVQGGFQALATAAAENVADYVVFGLAAALVPSRSADVRMVLFLAFCAVSGLWILNQNFQVTGIVTLAVGTVAAAEALARRGERSRSAEVRSAAVGAGILALVFLVPFILERSLGLATHFVLAMNGADERPILPKFDGIILANTRSSDDYGYLLAYAATIDDGARALMSLDSKPTGVAVFDFVNPFSAGLGLAPPRGDSSFNAFRRNVSNAHHFPAESYLHDVRIVMEPKWRISPETAEGLRNLYGPYLAANFNLVRETEFWKVHVRRLHHSGEPFAAAAPQRHDSWDADAPCRLPDHDAPKLRDLCRPASAP